MDSSVKHPIEWRIVSGFWDARIMSLLLLIDFIIGYFAWRIWQLVVAALLFSVVYLLGAWVAASGPISDPEYPWYLATKVREGAYWRSYWHDKFRYRLSRFLRRTFTSGRGNLFVRIQAFRASGSNGTPASDKDPPGLPDLLRAFQLRHYEMRYLLNDEDRWKRIVAEIPVLKKQIENSTSHEAAYLRYLTGVYFSFPEKERKLIQEHEDVTVWDWLERYPTRSWLFRIGVGLMIFLLLYQLLQIAWFPGL